MPSQLALAHIEAQRRVRLAAVQAVDTVWAGMSGHDRADLPAWLAQVLPRVQGAQRQSAALTRAYLERAIDRHLPDLDIDALVNSVRNGTPAATVYSRPFITLWSELGDGKPWEAASAEALARAGSAAAMDVQMTMRDTLGAVGRAAPEVIWGYQRVADASACDFCLECDGGQFTSDEPMPLHNFCGCGAEPVVYTRGVANSNALDAFNAAPTPPPAAVAINDHGELGPVLGAPGDHFLDSAAAGAR